MKYEQILPFSNTPIVPLSETPPTLEQMPLLVMLEDPFIELDVTSDQEIQIIGIRKEYKEAIKRTITKLPINCPN